METESDDPFVCCPPHFDTKRGQVADGRCAIAITKLIEPILIKNGLPGAAAALVCGDIEVGKELVGSEDIPLGTCPPSPA
jgi:hypothetical protein